MGLLDAFRPPPVNDPALGVLHRSRGKWRGQITLPASPAAELLVPGPRSGPDARAVALVAELIRSYPELRPTIELRIREHYRPYWDAIQRHGTGGSGSPRLQAPGDVWAEVLHMSVDVAPYATPNEILISYGLAWNEPRHVVGAWIRDGQLIGFLGDGD
jgi:hypothetical protein